MAGVEAGKATAEAIGAAAEAVAAAGAVAAGNPVAPGARRSGFSRSRCHLGQQGQRQPPIL